MNTETATLVLQAPDELTFWDVCPLIADGVEQLLEQRPGAHVASVASEKVEEGWRVSLTVDLP